MSIFARFNATDYKLVNLPEITTSTRETKFTDIQIDFTGKTASDLPIKYQEIKIVDTGVVPEEILYTGYANEPKLPTFDGTVDRIILTIDVLSPQTYLTKRTFTGTLENETIKDAVETILDGVVTNDGFTIEENTLPTTKYLSDIYSHTSIEKIMNDLGARFNFTWYVDELKGIYIKDLTVLQSETPTVSLTDLSNEYFKSMTPKVRAVDYGNKVHVRNAIVIDGQFLWPTNTGSYPFSDLDVTPGQMYKFERPLSISKNVAELTLGGTTLYWQSATRIGQYAASGSTFNIGILGQDDNGSDDMLFELDPNNASLAIGFKWNGSSADTLEIMDTETALYKYSANAVDPSEISNNAGKLNTSGIVEKDVNANGKYFDGNSGELIEYASSFLGQNNTQSNIVKLEFQGDVNDSGFTSLRQDLKFGNKIFINLPQYFVEATEFGITDVRYSVQDNLGLIELEARSTNFNETYIDIYRKPQQQLNETDSEFTEEAIYSQDERMLLAHKVFVNGEEVQDD